MHIQTSNQPEFSLGFNDYTCNWGIHVAGLYETEQERDEIIIPYLIEGARNNDMELYCPVERTADDFKEKAVHHCPECAGKLDDPDVFSFLSAKDLYYPDGTFSPRAMDKGLDAFYESSQAKGPRNIRATAEMVWALEAIPGKEHLMAYESRLNYFIPGKPWISICMYNIKKFDGSTIMNVLRTHPYTISKGVLTENPYYVEPDTWLKENAPEFLDT
jgi:hypothetical protein